MGRISKNRRISPKTKDEKIAIIVVNNNNNEIFQYQEINSLANRLSPSDKKDFIYQIRPFFKSSKRDRTGLS